MNYAKVVAGFIDEDNHYEEIQAQADLEFGRHLSSLEENLLFSKYSSEQIYRQINKVGK